MATDEQQSNADAAAAKVAALAAMYAAGALTREAFIETFALLTYAAKVKASRLAEVLLWRWSLDNWPDPIEPLGLVPDPDVMDVLRQAAETIVDDEPTPEETLVPEQLIRTVSEISRGAVSFSSGIEIVGRSERVAADAAKEAGRETTQTRLEREGVSHWRWSAHPDSCDECRKRDGRVYRIDVKFRDHFGCACELFAAIPDEIETANRKMRLARLKKENDDDRAAA